MQGVLGLGQNDIYYSEKTSFTKSLYEAGKINSPILTFHVANSANDTSYLIFGSNTTNSSSANDTTVSSIVYK